MGEGERVQSGAAEEDAGRGAREQGGEPLIVEREGITSPDGYKEVPINNSKRIERAGGVIPLVPVGNGGVGSRDNPLSLAGEKPEVLRGKEIAAKKATLETFTHTRDRAEEGIERLQHDLGSRAVGVVLTLKRFLPKVEALIKKVEWSGDLVNFYVCPACGADRSQGHHRGCLLEEVKKEMGLL